MEAGLFDSKVGFIIQARMSSTRLPGKVLMPLPFSGKKVLLQHIIDSIEPLGGTVVVATSNSSENDVLVDYCHSREISVFRGSEEDVLSRFISVQEKYKFEHIFRFTADNPLVDIAKLQIFYNEFLRLDLDYSYSKGMPLGMNFEVFTGSALLKTQAFPKTKSDREHVTPLLRNLNIFKKADLIIANQGELRMTVDTALDYSLMSIVFLCKQKASKNGLELINYIQDKYPWIFNINKSVCQKNSAVDEKTEIEAASKILDNLGFHRVVDIISNID